MVRLEHRVTVKGELLTLQCCLECQRQQARDDDFMEAPSRLLCVLDLLCYSLEAATRQHHLLHWQTDTTWETRPSPEIHSSFLQPVQVRQLNSNFCRQITCVCWAEDLQEHRRALLDYTGLGGHRGQSRQTPLAHCMMGMLLRRLIHGLWAEGGKGLWGIFMMCRSAALMLNYKFNKNITGKGKILVNELF